MDMAFCGVPGKETLCLLLATVLLLKYNPFYHSENYKARKNLAQFSRKEQQRKEVSFFQRSKEFCLQNGIIKGLVWGKKAQIYAYFTEYSLQMINLCQRHISLAKIFPRMPLNLFYPQAFSRRERNGLVMMFKPLGKKTPFCSTVFSL